MRIRRWAAAVAVPLLAAGMMLGAAGGAAAAEREAPVHLVNQDSAGNPLFRFDTDGNALDAHDGQLQRFGNTYYLYGTSYGCGFEWLTPGAPFCGFVSYSSPDLTHWKANGPLFDASTADWQQRCGGSTYGCFRPHVVFNRTTGKYVLWFNSYDNGVDYHVFTSSSPTSGFVESPTPKLALPPGPETGVNYGDEHVFVDDDGKAYLSYTAWTKGGDIIVERLDRTYTSGTGSYVDTGLSGTEAPTLFKRGSTYYLTFSDPNRGYATTGTSYITAPSPLGPWSGVKKWTIGGGALNIAGGGVGTTASGDSWTDYVFSAKVTPRKATNGDYAQAGLVFRSSPAGSYQWLIGNYPHSGATGGNLTKIVDGAVRSPVKLPIDIVTGQSYAVSITVRGSTIETRIDGRLVDTTTDSTLTAGRVGFREDPQAGENVTVDDVTVTDLSGRTLFSDDFSGDLAKWTAPTSGLKLTSTSCGGQPADVLPIATSAGTVYLYGSDVWNDGARNEALAKQYWAPLSFDSTGAIEPITCRPTADITVPVRHSPQTKTPRIFSGDLPYREYADIGGAYQRMQTFTAPGNGRLKDVRFATYQTGRPDQPLVVDVLRTNADGSPGATIASGSFEAAEVSWAPRWVTVPVPARTRVASGERLAIVVRSSTTRGAYGVLYNDDAAYAGGSESYSSNAGAGFSTEKGRVLRFAATVK